MTELYFSCSVASSTDWCVYNLTSSSCRIDSSSSCFRSAFQQQQLSQKHHRVWRIFSSIRSWQWLGFRWNSSQEIYCRCLKYCFLKYFHINLRPVVPKLFQWRLPCYIQIFPRLPESNFNKWTLLNSDSQWFSLQWSLHDIVGKITETHSRSENCSVTNSLTVKTS